MADAVPFTTLDRLIGTFSPGAARRRYAERIAIDILRRGYDGASRGRSTDGWTSGNKSADAEVAAAGGILRERMRDLVRNDALAAQAVQVLVNNIVGPGIRPRAKSGNKALNKRINALWDEFERNCDFHGHTDFHGLTALAVREMIEGGEALGIQRFQRSGTVPLKIELREGDHLDGSRAMFGPDGARIEQGIEYSAAGRRVAYWMFPDHPGGTSMAFGRRFASERVDASAVVHLFERQRVQNRGVPWGVAAMRAMRDFGDWHRAELARKKTEACLAAIVVSDDAGTDVGGTAGSGGGLGPAVVDADGNRIETFMPGMIGYSHSGRDVKFNQPSSAGGVGEWTKAQMHIIAAGFRVPYALMSGDMSNANFSSSRVGLNEFRRMVEQVQWQTVIPMFCQPIWDWFIDACRIAGKIPVSDALVPVEWAPPRFESVNPKQDAEADLLEVRAGFATLQQKIAARGYDPEDVIEEWRVMAELVDGAKLVFDSDPRRTSKGGQPAQAPGNQKTAEAAATPSDGSDDDDDDDAAPGGKTE